MLDTPLQVDLIGINARSEQTLTVALRGPARECCAIVHTDLAEAVIVDIDVDGSAEHWLQYRERYPNRPAIVFSSSPIELPSQSFLLLKPINISELIASSATIRKSILENRNSLRFTLGSLGSYAEDVVTEATNIEEDDATVALSRIHKYEFGSESNAGTNSVSETAEPTVVVGYTPPEKVLQEKVQFDYCGQSGDVDLQDESQTSELFFSGGCAFLEVVALAWQQSQERKCNRQIEFSNNGTIYFDHIRQCAYTNLTEGMLQRMCLATEMTGDVISTNFPIGHDVEFFETIDTVVTAQPTESLLWSVSLWTYKGKLPRSMDLNARIYLRHWPDFPKLLNIPHAMRIASLWTTQPMSLEFTASVLKIPQRYIFSFYIAAHHAGLAGVAMRDSDYLIEEQPPAPEPAKKVEFFGRVVGHLKKVINNGT